MYNILLQVFEDGQLTDGLGNTVDFKNTIIIMTSNLGARFLDKKGQMGFAAPSLSGHSAEGGRQVMSEVKKGVQSRIPEPPGRSDPVHVADGRGSAEDHQPAGGADQPESGRQADQDPGAAKTRLATFWRRRCTDRSYGARPLRRALQKYIEDPLSDALIQGSLPRPSELEVYLGDAGIYCRPVKELAGAAGGRGGWRGRSCSRRSRALRCTCSNSQFRNKGPEASRFWPFSIPEASSGDQHHSLCCNGSRSSETVGSDSSPGDFATVFPL